MKAYTNYIHFAMQKKGGEKKKETSTVTKQKTVNVCFVLEKSRVKALTFLTYSPDS